MKCFQALKKSNTDGSGFSLSRIALTCDPCSIDHRSCIKLCCPHLQIGSFQNGKFSCHKPAELYPSFNPPMWIPNFAGLGALSVRNSDYLLLHDPDFTRCPEHRKNPTGGFFDVHESEKSSV